MPQCPSTFEEQFSGARTYLSLAHPFFAALLAHFRVEPDTGAKTAFVTPRDAIHINPGFFAGIASPKRRAFLLAHEICHPMLGYFLRARGRDPRIANIAHDYVVNGMLAKERGDWVIPGALVHPWYDGMAFEEVYALLAKRPPADLPDLPWNDADAAMTPAAAGGDEDQQAKGAVWARRVLEADLVARAQGQRSATADEIIRSALDPQVPWTERLRLAAVEALGAARLDWSRPHRRTEALGVYLPKIVDTGYDTAVYVDTSGSISEEQLATAVGEIGSIIRVCGGRIRWMEGDAKILRDEWIDSPPTQISGRGGTSFVPLFDALRESPARLVVVFTDTFGEMPASTPPLPVLWAVYRPTTGLWKPPAVPFGEVVEVPERAL